MRVDTAKLQSGQVLSFGDFNVFVGGNGVGKTTFLVELFHKLAGLSRTRFFWVNEASHSSTEPAEDLKRLKDSFARQREGLNWFYFSQGTKNIEGNIDLENSLRFSQ